jgi:hypothetical protein
MKSNEMSGKISLNPINNPINPLNPCDIPMKSPYIP